MKYIKKFEAENWKEEPIKLKLGRYVLLKTSKSLPHPTMGFYTKVKDINILIDHRLVGNMQIDERGFNLLHHYDSSMNIGYDEKKDMENLPDYLEKFKKIIIEYLLNCHLRMKLSNPLYGTYGINGIRRGEGQKPLLTHDFIDFVKNDYKTSKLQLVKEIKVMNKNLPLYKNTIKYGL